ncbi:MULTISPECIES: HPP family protein [unclassified Oleiphilus]|jgi:CBS-domain-containing membrane protein|nr:MULTISPECIES: CBS domain-containing protein [unclassified Oleiphilus]KZY75915.1 hypothetical protein A3740_14205 [Oleiphilus sp. HI0068]KZY76782.1 hypothetical protein A3741_10670 [Oleiphilus sp. HI0069]KZY87442.1 hypothetical protein A3743_14435 [Oleiphilus sp. HI0072]KZZ11700.1 hypothetical protein A3749_08260 [Oleiphilus sp. HI0078]KZZ30826.1 hypothetical protein A3755_13060 [Oleiphilus sp. HI0085]
MFYVYSPSGRAFAGPLEKLRKVEKPANTSTIPSLNYTEVELEENEQARSSYDVPVKAISEYQNLLKKNSQQEAVYHAYQVMSQPVVSVQLSDTWGYVLELFEQVHYQVVPVLDNKGQLVSVISRQQIYAKLLSQSSVQMGRDTSLSSVIQTRGKSVVSADPVTDVRRVAKALVMYSLDAIPIVDAEHRLVGIVSRTDILRCVTANPPLSMWC